MTTNLLNDHFRSPRVAKDKERDVEKEIFSVLWEQALPYGKLHMKMKRCPHATLTKYLKHMVSDETVQYHEGIYQLKPTLKELLKVWREKNEKAITDLQERIKELEGDTYFMVEAARTSKDARKLRISFADSVRKDIATWYRSYYKGMFIVITGALPAGIVKEMKYKCNSQLKIVEEFMKFIKGEDPLVHALLSDPSHIDWGS